MSEEITLDIVIQGGSSVSFKFFTDDTIEVLRNKIGNASGMHPDRLRIYVREEFDEAYYSSDSRRWENLFLRMSPDGKPVLKALEYYNKSRDPPLAFPNGRIEKNEWNGVESKSPASFLEYRILGVPEERSWVFPLNNTEDPEYLPPASLVTIDMKMLFKTLHPHRTSQFLAIPATEGLNPSRALIYYPRLAQSTPLTVPTDMMTQLKRQDDVARSLSELSAPKPESASITSIRWKLSLVNTDFGISVRNKFEQIFYGTTVSEATPVVSLFTSRLEQSRHKFFTNNVRKTPFLNTRLWLYWWATTRPSKSKPALVFYNGKTRGVFDRVTVTATDIVISSTRHDEETHKPEELFAEAKSFLMSIDGLIAMVDPRDYADNRWVVQDTSVDLRYASELVDADLRRFDCLRGVYDLANPEKLQFRFLRADQSGDTGFTNEEIRIVQMLKETPGLDAGGVTEQIPGLSTLEASELLARVKEAIDEDPELADHQFANVPTFRFTSKSVILTHANDTKRLSTYASSLRHVLLHPDDDNLNDVCPKRSEAVPAQTAKIPVVSAPEVEAFGDDLMDLLEQTEVAPGAIQQKDHETVEEPKKRRRIRATGVSTTLSNYILTEMRKFDPQTFDPDDTNILKKCEKKRQPIALPIAEAHVLDVGPYAVPESNTLEVADPDGIIICPEYWCTVDRIPLTKAQIDEAGGCPICHGKVRSNDKAVEPTQNLTEFPVLYRDGNLAYPGLVNYRSKKNNREIPCCFKNPQKKIVVERSGPTAGELFYILGETKGVGEKRFAYIPEAIGKLAGIPINYKQFVDANNRISAGQAGFFRVGMGRPSKTLPSILNVRAVSVIPEPLKKPAATIRCSFFSTWDREDVEHTIEGHSDKVSARVASINKAFVEGELTQLQELEYACHVAECWAYVLYMTPDGPQTECFMNMNAVLRADRAVAVLVYPDSVDYLCHVARSGTHPVFNGNITHSLFSKSVRKTLEHLRETSCNQGNVPTVEKADAVLGLPPDKIQVILDPYERAQAFFSPGKFILPFRPTSQIPQLYGTHLKGYADIKPDEYPTKAEMVEILLRAKEIHPGYAYVHDNTDVLGNVVEIITTSGLRIPVRSEPGGVPGTPTEITQTVAEENEEALVVAMPDQESVMLARSVTYEAEIFDFLLFQLTKDLHADEAHAELRGFLTDEPKKHVDEVRKALGAWFKEAVHMSGATDVPTFYKKLRTPCGGQPEGECKTSALCHWDGASCQVEVKRVRETLEETTLKKRLLSTLVSNDKIRSIVLDNRMSPFFSSILYLVLPSEVIFSDQDVTKFAKA